jgi:hypothetical protein
MDYYPDATVDRDRSRSHASIVTVYQFSNQNFMPAKIEIVVLQDNEGIPQHHELRSTSVTNKN